jgi:hypothetical protein
MQAIMYQPELTERIPLSDGRGYVPCSPEYKAALAERNGIFRPSVEAPSSDHLRGEVRNRWFELNGLMDRMQWKGGHLGATVWFEPPGDVPHGWAILKKRGKAEGASLPGEGDATIEVVSTENETIVGGPTWCLTVPNALLRQWIVHLLAKELEDGPVDLSRSQLLDMAVPDALESACSALDSLAETDAEAAFEDALGHLDQVVGGALGLKAADIEYVQLEMGADPFLRHINPMWEKRGLSRQSYRDRVDVVAD